MAATNSSIDFNSTNFDANLCTLQTCPLAYASVTYDPTLAGNALYLAIFSLFLVIQAFLSLRYRTWTFLLGLVGGLVLEIVGYVARVQMHYNPFLADPFLMYLICLTIAPCFFSASIYLCLTRIIHVYGDDLARFAPRTYTKTFISCDVLSLVLQAVGGALADTAGNDHDLSQTGVDIMIAGLSFQVASLTVFVALCSDFAWSVRKHRSLQRPKLLRCSERRFKAFLYALSLATLCIYIRSCFRVAELQGGFSGKLANEEIPLMILEGGMITIACIALTVAHPGMVFGEGWNTSKTKSQAASEDKFSIEVEHGRSDFEMNLR